MKKKPTRLVCGLLRSRSDKARSRNMRRSGVGRKRAGQPRRTKPDSQPNVQRSKRRRSVRGSFNANWRDLMRKARRTKKDRSISPPRIVRPPRARCYQVGVPRLRRRLLPLWRHQRRQPLLTQVPRKGPVLRRCPVLNRSRLLAVAEELLLRPSPRTHTFGRWHSRQLTIVNQFQRHPLQVQLLQQTWLQPLPLALALRRPMYNRQILSIALHSKRAVSPRSRQLAPWSTSLESDRKKMSGLPQDPISILQTMMMRTKGPGVEVLSSWQVYCSVQWDLHGH